MIGRFDAVAARSRYAGKGASGSLWVRLGMGLGGIALGWILDNAASVAGLIALNEPDANGFFGKPLRRWRYWGLF